MGRHTTGTVSSPRILRKEQLGRRGAELLALGQEHLSPTVPFVLLALGQEHLSPKVPFVLFKSKSTVRSV